MREREIDNLFRKKLETHGVNPSEAAWGRIENQIRPDKVTWRFYVGIAASILLIAIVSVIIFYPKNEISGTMAEENSPVLEQGSNETLPQVVENQMIEDIPSETENVLDESPKQVNSSNTTQRTKRSDTNPGQHTPAVLIAESTSKEEVTIEENEIPLSLAKTTGIVGISDKEKTAPIALNVSQIDISIPDGTEEESSRGINLKKVLDIAKNLKSDNEGWSTLREAKNELLAFGRKKDNTPEDIQD